MDPTTFRWDPDQGVLWAGVRSYPATFHRDSARDHMPPDTDFLVTYPEYRMETRQAVVWFENQWQLSTIWGDATYSSNSMWASRVEPQPFIEEPTLVEVGVLMPIPIKIAAQEYDLPSGKVEMPERETTLWGDPLGYVDVATFHRVADLVMMLPTDVDLPEGEWDTAEGFCDLLITAGLDRAL
jgi:hypothetical protein